MNRHQSNELALKTNEVERYLFRCASHAERQARIDAETSSASNPAKDYPLVVLKLEIEDLGSWLIKFREHNNLIINHCDTILADCVKVSALIAFSSVQTFWATINGTLTLDEAVARSEGPPDVMKLFHLKIFSHSVLAASDDGVSIRSSMNAEKDMFDSNLGPRTAPDRGLLLSSEDITNQLLKSGWLLKKKDLMRGWNSRYFKIYVGRFEYYMDPNDEIPRAVIPSYQANVSNISSIQTKRQSHYGINVKPSLVEKTFRLASERVGEDGYDEMESWSIAFDLSGKAPEKAAALLLKGGNSSPAAEDVSRVRDGDINNVSHLSLVDLQELPSSENAARQNDHDSRADAHAPAAARPAGRRRPSKFGQTAAALGIDSVLGLLTPQGEAERGKQDSSKSSNASAGNIEASQRAILLRFQLTGAACGFFLLGIAIHTRGVRVHSGLLSSFPLLACIAISLYFGAQVGKMVYAATTRSAKSSRTRSRTLSSSGSRKKGNRSRHPSNASNNSSATNSTTNSNSNSNSNSSPARGLSKPKVASFERQPTYNRSFNPSLSSTGGRNV